MSIEAVKIELEEVQADSNGAGCKKNQINSNQLWLWYVISAKNGKVLAWHMGKRTDASLKSSLTYSNS